ncbi:oligopeptide/dipeptide ABC transporter ATP-binding protein [Thermodesulfobacteriota bacterium]
MPSGCRFHPRCPNREKLCVEKEPDLDSKETQHSVACHFPLNI